MASGVKVHEECKLAYIDTQLKHKHQFIIYRLNEKLTEIIVEEKGDVGAPYEEFMKHMIAAEEAGQCRYGIFDVAYMSKENHQKNKLAFIFWAPENAKIKQKMVYSASKDVLKSTLGTGISTFVQANDHGDITWDHVLEECRRLDRD